MYFAFIVFSLGMIGTGTLSIPVLAGSAAYAASECFSWNCSLESTPWEAKGFYAVISAATFLGFGLEFTPINPVTDLFWSAVSNWFFAVPITVGIMMVVSRSSRMKQFTARPILITGGRAATGVIASAATAKLVFR
ncbi:divalent metal cation transporter [Sinorhizobium sp. RAC02]|uniref:divalent metal cation transporter n=1 Tax=Sinorhizobium sp. RAC02 TaxID=1842534 RepID=UPI00083D2C6A|nr:divalent metal cation transporter [Sinorhizobium sp. RAC02]AOF93367.1 natural resistance-associated macrophage family protein [Sinorhizobium sp. RAC02]